MKLERMADVAGPMDQRRRRLLKTAAGWGAAALGGTLLGGCAARQGVVRGQGTGLVPPFSGGSTGASLPVGWHPYIIRKDRPLTRYDLVEREGQTVLHAISHGSRSGLQCPVDLDPLATPWLRWQWRVDEVHVAASVEDDDTEDTPARIVVAFDGDHAKLSLRDQLFFDQVELFTGNVLPYATLTYVWDGHLPVGTVLPYARTRRIQYQVVETGTQGQGQWLSYERNVADDFRRVFGEEPGRIIHVGLLTDSDDLKNRAEAWYGDIGFHAGSAWMTQR